MTAADLPFPLYCKEMHIAWHRTLQELYLGLPEFLINLINQWIMKNFLLHRFSAAFMWVWPFFGWALVGVGTNEHFLPGCGWMLVDMTFFWLGVGSWEGVTFLAVCGWAWVIPRLITTQILYISHLTCFPCFCCKIFVTVNPLMTAGNKRSNVLKQTCSF